MSVSPSSGLTIHPAYRFGRVCFANGVPVDPVVERIEAGDSVESVMEDFGLSRDDVLLGCWWLWEDEDRRTRLGKWAVEAALVLGGHRDRRLCDPPIGVPRKRRLDLG